MITEESFYNACNAIIGKERKSEGIGTLGEKTLHAVIKSAYEPDSALQEIKVGRFFADIAYEKSIIEVQTRNFFAMKKKLEYFLNLDKYQVTIVYPLPHIKWILWLDKETGEISEKRKSPKCGSPCDALSELWQIREYLMHPKLKICLVMLDISEYRNLDGWSKDKKRGSSRYERVPEKYVEMMELSCKDDYMALLPKGLGAKFTIKEFAKAAKLGPSSAGRAVNMLKHIGVLGFAGKQGRAFLYSFLALTGS